jgi:hypothetical protein
MAVLLLAAGIAWLLVPHVEVGSALHTAAPGAAGAKQKRSAEPAPTTALEEQPAAPPGANAPPARDERSLVGRTGAAPQPTLEMRAREGGGQAAGGAPPPQAPPAPAGRELKKQSMAEHQFAAAPPPSEPGSTAPAVSPQAAAEKDALVPGAAQELSATSQSARNEATLRAGRADEVKVQLEGAPALVIQCGKVTDTRGTPLGGVQITLLGASTRSSRSAADGSFCLPRAVAGDTLILMHIGFEPVRLVLAPSTSLAFGLEPVGTLGSRGGLALGGGARGLLHIPPAAGVPTPDVYAGESDSVRIAVTRARQRTANARRAPSAGGWEAAASSWEGIAARTSGRAGSDARFEQLSALREAWRLAPTPARAERLRALLDTFIAAAPATLPERATAIRWQEELATPVHH